MLSVEELDLACADLARQLRLRGDIPAAELDAAVPALDAPATAWLAYHGQLHRWLAAPAAAVGGDSEHDEADRAVLDALAEAPVPVVGLDLRVHPKSFATLMHLAAIDRTLDGLTRLFATCTADEATVAERDQVESLGMAIAYALGLVVWAWTTPGPGLPWDPGNASPALPPDVESMRPDEMLAVHNAVVVMHRRLSALQVLVDPARAEQGGARPSWSALFHSLGMGLGVGADALLVTRSLDSVLAMARLEVARNAPPPER